MTNQFEKAVAIRRGERDDEMPSYEELKQWIGRVPDTWLPGLLLHTTCVATSASVFADGELVKAVERREQWVKEGNRSILRDSKQSHAPTTRPAITEPVISKAK